MSIANTLNADSAFEPRAFWFGSEANPMLGWYHPAQKNQDGEIRQCGVVLCPPFGHEYMVSYRAYKHLANSLAAAGFAVCFFDYNGSGDSADAGGDRVALWQDNIRTAATQLRTMAGVSDIALFGLRLGALLAVSVAQDVSATALILMAPVTSGRAYVRELLALRSMSPIQADTHGDPAYQVTDDELTGYEFSATTRASLSKLDMLKAPRPTSPVLILSRDDISGQEAKLANAWHSEEHTLHLSDTSGYAAMMTEDAYQTVVPELLWSETVQWLSSHFSQKKAAKADNLPVQKQVNFSVEGVTLTEVLVDFDGLHGVLSYSGGTPSSGLPAVILTNIGANHRVGNHRIYVTLARHLATQGFYVLRFDKAGVGYSKPTPDGQEHDVHNLCGIDDIRSAMRLLQQHYDVAGFVLAGLCSGAYLSYMAAIDEPRVRGLIMMNQLTYRWREGDTIDDKKKDSIKSTHFYVQAAVDAHTWKRLLTGKIELRQIAVKLTQRVGKRLRTYFQSAMTRFMQNHHFLGRAARNLRAMEARGVELMLILEASDGSVDVMTEQFGRNARLLGKSDRIRLEILKGTDHTFTPRWAQTYIADLITRHLRKRLMASSANLEE
ncbi:MAG: alpha/beta fold hydrolase [Burkholderiales bacterium]|nr:alpha/beta fold hydrolase [Burkholderiales bacterium]